MVAPKGRPKSENTKDYMLRVRMDKETLEKLDKCCKEYSLSRSEVVRNGISEQHGKIKK
jgi:metal-responsive CopG/Arc/MetJ family transcriptional regulator